MLDSDIDKILKARRKLLDRIEKKELHPGGNINQENTFADISSDSNGNIIKPKDVKKNPEEFIPPGILQTLNELKSEIKELKRDTEKDKGLIKEETSSREKIMPFDEGLGSKDIIKHSLSIKRKNKEEVKTEDYKNPGESDVSTANILNTNIEGIESKEAYNSTEAEPDAIDENIFTLPKISKYRDKKNKISEKNGIKNIETDFPIEIRPEKADTLKKGILPKERVKSNNQEAEDMRVGKKTDAVKQQLKIPEQKKVEISESNNIDYKIDDNIPNSLKEKNILINTEKSGSGDFMANKHEYSPEEEDVDLFAEPMTSSELSDTRNALIDTLSPKTTEKNTGYEYEEMAIKMLGRVDRAPRPPPEKELPEILETGLLKVYKELQLLKENRYKFENDNVVYRILGEISENLEEIFLLFGKKIQKKEN